jgi:hypothetical protein
MYPIGVDVNERAKHECSLMTPRVWQCKCGGGELDAFHGDQIEIDRSRPEPGVGVSNPSERGFHIEEAREGIKRICVQIERDHTIDEGRLVLFVHRRRLVE